MDKYDDLKYAKLDTDRETRTGFPEVVFCEGKPDEYLIGIYKRLIEHDGRVFGTRASEHQYEVIREVIFYLTCLCPVPLGHTLSIEEIF